jgi:hypothetical protein
LKSFFFRKIFVRIGGSRNFFLDEEISDELLNLKKLIQTKRDRRPSVKARSGRFFLGIGLAKKNEHKNKGRGGGRRPILYLAQLFTFLSKFLPFYPSFNPQKHFLMFSTSTIYSKDILRKQFSIKDLLKKK